MVLENPAAENDVAQNYLSGFVEQFQYQLFPKVLERDFLTGARAGIGWREVLDFVGPFLELGVVCDCVFQGDGFVGGSPWRFARHARKAAVPMFNHFRLAFQSADFADSGDVVARA